MRSFLIEPSRFRLDGGAMFGIVPKPLWSKVALPDKENRIDLSLRLWVIQTERRLIVVDTGIGSHQGETFKNRFDVRGGSSPLSAALEVLGKTCDQVTDLVLTHLHFDHAGGIGERVGKGIVPVFQNARCHLHKGHYDYSKNTTERDAGSFDAHIFGPVLEEYKKGGKLLFYEGEEGTLLKEGNFTLRFKVSHGHTPFMMHPYDAQNIYLADLVPTSHHVHVPWVMSYDMSPGQSTKDKRVFLDFAREKNLRIIFEHDPKYWGARIEKDEKGRFSCKELFPAKESLAYPLA